MRAATAGGRNSATGVQPSPFRRAGCRDPIASASARPARVFASIALLTSTCSPGWQRRRPLFMLYFGFAVVMAIFVAMGAFWLRMAA